MRIVAQFDPSIQLSDTFNAGFSGGAGKLVIYNESNINLNLAWGAFTTYCPAWTAMLYCITVNNVNITWTQQSQLSSNNAPISQVIVEAYDTNEPVLGTYPAPLVRQSNIGNAINLGGTATNIVNDGSASGTQIVEATPSGGSTATQVFNNGKIVLGNGSVAPSIICSQYGVAATGDLIDAFAIPGTIYIKAGGGAIVFQSPNGVDIARLDQNGNLTIKGALTQHGSP